ncbi:MAG: aspartate carbamoyltransferase catalytic subunit [Cyanobacteria bacterium SIG30]|nr:aspartate carbamoyltransferase catalytic subunit [Cyanobacteria bacterium SIG30]
MRHLTSIKNLEKDEILKITELANLFENKKYKTNLVNKNVCLMFFENSTRTKFSFEMAINNLGFKVFNFETDKTSLSKGESISDTIQNLSAIGINSCVIRSREAIIEDLINSNSDMHFINAGEGQNSHPTQALLDFYTIKKYYDDLSDKKIVIVGDIKHSRVAKSNVELLSRFNANITLICPNYFKDDSIKNVKYSENLNEELKDADIVMGLRIQKERIEENLNFEDYIKNFQITSKNINRNSLLMHPGPVNRNIEITSELIDSSQGKTILEQARNGVFVRMAVLDLVMGDRK